MKGDRLDSHSFSNAKAQSKWTVFSIIKLEPNDDQRWGHMTAQPVLRLSMLSRQL